MENKNGRMRKSLKTIVPKITKGSYCNVEQDLNIVNLNAKRRLKSKIFLLFSTESSRVQGFKGSRVQGFKGSKVQRFKSSIELLNR
jgi:hypothetical protein